MNHCDTYTYIYIFDIFHMQSKTYYYDSSLTRFAQSKRRITERCLSGGCCQGEKTHTASPSHQNTNRSSHPHHGQGSERQRQEIFLRSLQFTLVVSKTNKTSLEIPSSRQLTSRLSRFPLADDSSRSESFFSLLLLSYYYQVLLS